ncbi:MAG: alpha-galactosidase [Erythrobacter sp.]|uniref:alpha-galactosidase n=1 Tax=Erythrobacter sp. TaxID=1042 RepID=UPI003A87C271
MRFFASARGKEKEGGTIILTQGVHHVRLDGGAITLVFALVEGGTADVVYLGARLPEGEDLAALAHSTMRGRHENQADPPPVPGIVPQAGHGWQGSPAASFRHISGEPLHTDLRLISWFHEGSELTCRFADTQANIHLSTHWAIKGSDTVFCDSDGWNENAEPIVLERLASISMPIPRRFADFTAFSGRWAGEMRESRQPIAPNGFARRSAGGKPGFGGGNWLLLHADGGEEVLGFHLASSGDHDTRIECDNIGSADGRAILQIGAAFPDGGEIIKPQGAFGAPPVLFALGQNRSELAHAFHRHARGHVQRGRQNWGPRKVHLNSWEALAFDLSESGLIALAESAAEIGVERFVLDDGWFGGRRNDQSSLGDWFVSAHVFPHGLDPLIQRVHALDMDFGLWVEPEMVSPESDLYRAHPDWCLHLEGRDRPTMRGQLALDLTRQEVRDYLFERLDALLRDHAIAYLKWDHNRDLFPAGARQSDQVSGFYRLLDRLRAAHPDVEIESCSSGGGRIDFSVLSRVQRVWPSDNNDPIERVRIMRAWSQFLPLEVLGNHVGPSPNPITGRQTDMDFRAKVALFGHMGVEADPGAMSEAEREVLKAHIALYKQWREVLHSGDLHFLDHPDPAVYTQIVVGDTSALALAAQTGFSGEFDAAPVRLKGLDPEAHYRVTLLLPWPQKAALYLPNKRHWRDGFSLSGRSLMTQGLALPLTHPETAWLIALEKVSA